MAKDPSNVWGLTADVGKIIGGSEIRSGASSEKSFDRMVRGVWAARMVQIDVADRASLVRELVLRVMRLRAASCFSASSVHTHVRPRNQHLGSGLGTPPD